MQTLKTEGFLDQEHLHSDDDDDTAASEDEEAGADTMESAPFLCSFYCSLVNKLGVKSLDYYSYRSIILTGPSGH